MMRQAVQDELPPLPAVGPSRGHAREGSWQR
jgi:hypothetical protein